MPTGSLQQFQHLLMLHRPDRPFLTRTHTQAPHHPTLILTAQLHQIARTLILHPERAKLLLAPGVRTQA